MILMELVSNLFTNLTRQIFKGELDRVVCLAGLVTDELLTSAEVKS